MTTPSPSMPPSFWARWGLNHLEVLCAGAIAGAYVAGRLGLTTIAIFAGVVCVTSWLLRHIVRGA